MDIETVENFAKEDLERKESVNVEAADNLNKEISKFIVNDYL